MSKGTPFNTTIAQVECHLDFASRLALLNVEHAAKVFSDHISITKDLLSQPAGLAIRGYDQPGSWLVDFGCSAIDHWKAYSIDCFEYQYRISQVLAEYSAKENSGR